MTSWITLLYLLSLLFLIYSSLKTTKASHALFKKVAGEQLRLQRIINILVMSNPDMVARSAFSKIVSMPMGEIDSLNIKNFYNKCAVETLQDIRVKIKGDLEEFNRVYPGTKNDAVLELENLVTLICTVDESSSPEYIQQIYFEIMMGLKKLDS